jgi:crotonobetainyl-CoA:carnitine CoA-transferase CaiB-like acyl-CoA transferase
MAMNSRLPFAGLRIVELGTVVAGPFAGSLFADLGAEIIKIEPPGQPDIGRNMGHTKNGVSPWWGVGSRDKKCITLNLKAPEGKALFKSLIQKSDALIDNYRPGMLDKMELGWPVLHEVNPKLIQLTISGFGGTGPKAMEPGFGKIAEGLSGILSLTGQANESPLFVGYSLADTTTGLFGTFAAAVALYNRDVRGGEGVRIDLGLYEGLLRMLDCQFALQARTGKASLRQGTNDPYGWGQDPKGKPRFQCVKCAGGDWLMLRIPTPDVERRIIGAAPGKGEPSVSLEAWAEEQEPEAVRRAVMLAGGDVVPVIDGMSAAGNAYFRARGDVLPAHHDAIGDFSVPGPIYPRQDGNDPRNAFRVEELGQHNDEVYGQILGVSREEFDRLKSQGIV